MHHLIHQGGSSHGKDQNQHFFITSNWITELLFSLFCFKRI